MATVTKPIALDESINTTEQTPRNIADVLAQELQAVAGAIGGIAVPSADHVSYDNSVSGLSATDVQNAIDELSSEKVDKEVGKGLSTNDYTTAEKTKLAGIEAGAEVNPTSSAKTATESFETVDGGLLSKCAVDLEPIQDLHGYSEPWVGGAGKNLIDLQGAFSSFTDANTSLLPTGEYYVYIFTENNVSSYNSFVSYSTDGNTFTEITTTDDGVAVCDARMQYGLKKCHITLHQNAYLSQSLQINEYVSGKQIYAMITKDGTNYSSIANVPPYSEVANIWQPYSNICPISGHTEVDLDVKDGDNVTQHTYQVQIGSTVYGGYVDLVSGVMMVDRVYCKLANQSLVRRGTNTSGIYRYAFAPNPAGQIGRYVNVISNALVTKDAYASYERTSENCITPDANGNYINFYASDKQTDTDWITFATNNDVEIVYPLDTPQTIQLTPQQIEALVGQNNLSTPLSGQSIDSIEYREVFAFDDVEKVVSLRVPISMLGTDESGRTTASQSYASGDYFYKDGYMCKALTSISAGATLTLNTNYSQGTLADILKAIENA